MKMFEVLLKGLDCRLIRGAQTPIFGLTDDSREVKPGWAFVACRGQSRDGHEFIAEALSRGARALITERVVAVPEGVALAVAPDTRAVLGELAARFYDFPAQRLTLIGITGTNGKTSVAWFVREMLRGLGQGVGLLGTIHYDLGTRRLPARETTPGCVRLHRYLAEMVRAGLTHAVMEVSSHALDQDRINPLRFQIAVFTNLSRDHLDYHRDMEAYFQAKKKLFGRYLLSQGKAVVNVSDPWGRRLALELGGQAIRVGEGTALRGSIEAREPGGYRFVLEYQDRRYTLATRLYGDFQLENLLLSVAVGLALGFPLEEIGASLSGISAPPGRLELVACYRGGLVFIDYAHTPGALASALQSLRPLVRNRLVCIFGCGGQRDRGKRPLMGEVAALLADKVVLTSDNPRGEPPEEIVAQILKGIPPTKEPEVILDRREAIYTGLKDLKEGDVLLIAGKGHEDYQEIAGIRYPFSDQEVVREFLFTEGR